MTAVTELETWQEQKAKIDRFVARFGNEAYRSLAHHAALPLVLTPELVNYLRNEFLRGEEVPWEAEVDLLLSDLCSQVGYELYAMDTQVRAYLLAEMQESPFWQQRMREVAQVLIGYVNFLSRVNPEQRKAEIEAQRLAAMVYLGDETCQEAVQEIAERLKQTSDAAEQGEKSERTIKAELARLARITQELSPQLQQFPALVEYARLVQRLLKNPEQVDPAELRRSYQVGDVDLTVSPRIFSTVVDELPERADLSGFPLLQVLDFETGKFVGQDFFGQDFVIPPLQSQTVEVVTLFFEQPSAPSEARTELLVRPFTFEIATLEETARKQWQIKRRMGNAWLYEEPLGNSLTLEMVVIPPGSFVMGSPENEPERFSREGPQHTVQLNGFYMGRYPVNQAQWHFVVELPRVKRELKPDPSRFKGENRPVEKVSWLDAVEFCARLSQFTQLAYRLPTEAEWEYACRARTTTPFHFGETISAELANYRGTETYNSGPKGEYRQETTPVDQFGVANAFGLCDMHGNVYEWCQDQWHGNYEDAPSDGIAWVDDAEDEDVVRVVRGGSWYSDPWYCRSAYRDNYNPRDVNGNIGFRVVCSTP